MNKRKLKDTLIAAAWEENEGAYHVRLEDVFEIIDQLDEPEKVVVPEFVGEWIENAKEDECSLSKAFWLIFSNVKNTGGNVTENWIYDNPELFARAWLDGYEVEEKKYEVKDKNDCFLLTKNSEGEVINAYSKVVYKNKGYLTEQEIKDYDERFWPFAEEVES
jgi:hypothetical protein